MKAISEEEVLQRYLVNENGCHIFQGIIHSRGYGVVSQKSKTYRAHRFFYEKKKGAIPKGLYVRHLCHEKSCVNPDHLELGTQLENMQDMVRAGRQAKGDKIANHKVGDRNAAAKLDWVKVDQIRLMRANGYKLKDIASVYGISEATVSVICSGKSWTKRANGRYELREIDLS